MTEPHFASTVDWPEMREHLVKHQQLLNWLETRLIAMGVGGVSWVHYAEVERSTVTGEETVSVGFERWDETTYMNFTWDELADASNETWERKQRERREAELKRRAAQERTETEQRVVRLERELEAARAKLEEDK